MATIAANLDRMISKHYRRRSKNNHKYNYLYWYQRWVVVVEAATENVDLKLIFKQLNEACSRYHISHKYIFYFYHQIGAVVSHQNELLECTLWIRCLSWNWLKSFEGKHQWWSTKTIMTLSEKVEKNTSWSKWLSWFCS
jgi:hypothetical protein